MKHGDTTGEIPPEAALSDDPALWMVNGDMHAFYEAKDKNCECNGVCNCPHNREDGDVRN